MKPLNKVAASIVLMVSGAPVIAIASELGLTKGWAVVLGVAVLLCGLIGTLYYMERHWESQRRA